MKTLLILLLFACSSCNEEILKQTPPPPSQPNIHQKEGYLSNDTLSLFQVDPLLKITPEVESFPYNDDTLRVARGENATLQLQVKAGVPLTEVTASLQWLQDEAGNTLPTSTLGWVKLIKASHHYTPASPDNIGSASNQYPDPILTDISLELDPNQKGCLWVDIPVPHTAVAGLYHGSIQISGNASGKKISLPFTFHLQIYPVTITQQRLLVTNWEQGDPLTTLNQGEPVPFKSELYWELRKKLIRISGDYGTNAWRIQYQSPRVSIGEDGTSFSFDFAPFDEEVEFYLQNVPVAQIHGLHFAGRDGGWVAPFKVTVPYINNNHTLSYASLPPSDVRVKAYLSAYFSALQAHLRSKPLNDGTNRTWLDIFAQFIADEPIDSNLSDWEEIARIVKEAAPEIKIIEAYRASTLNKKLIDYPVPQLDELAYFDHYKNSTRADNVWFYTCMYPRGNYANRFIELPLLKTRILHWINYKYNAVGYLHWGLNYWVTDVYNESSVAASDWPGGDAYIIYPGNHKVYPSIRLAAMRDGIKDYELLRMIEDKSPEKAREFADQIILDYDQYNMNVPHFRQVRKEMLEFLSNAN